MNSLFCSGMERTRIAIASGNYELLRASIPTMNDLPNTMRAVQLMKYDGRPQSITFTDNLPVPHPGPGQVLIKVAASPINPSDLAFLMGMYGFKKPLPCVPGFEGSGTVVASGAGAMARFLKGKRVACTVADARIPGGMWAEYVVTTAAMCVPLAKHVSTEQGAMMLVNPISAWAMVEEARKAGHKAIVQTAAASALGKMVARLGKRFSLPVINVVRRTEQVDALRAIGAEHVLDSSSAGFDEKLKTVCHQLSATYGIDAVAGELTGRVMKAQPKGSRMFVYGGLSLKPAEVDAGSLIFEGKVLAGFWVSAWLTRKGMVEKLRIAKNIQSLLATDLKSDVNKKLPLQETANAVEQYIRHMSAGKVLIIP
jgi:NADPH:quinone reductase-like Zn-dependent oxidoreductase